MIFLFSCHNENRWYCRIEKWGIPQNFGTDLPNWMGNAAGCFAKSFQPIYPLWLCINVNKMSFCRSFIKIQNNCYGCHSMMTFEIVFMAGGRFQQIYWNEKSSNSFWRLPELVIEFVVVFSSFALALILFCSNRSNIALRDSFWTKCRLERSTTALIAFWYSAFLSELKLWSIRPFIFPIVLWKLSLFHLFKGQPFQRL